MTRNEQIDLMINNIKHIMDVCEDDDFILCSGCSCESCMKIFGKNVGCLISLNEQLRIPLYRMHYAVSIKDSPIETIFCGYKVIEVLNGLRE